MQYNPGVSWSAGTPAVPVPVVTDNRIQQLLEATLQATACGVAAVFAEDGDGYQRIGHAGDPLAELVEIVPTSAATRLPSGAFQIAPAAAGGGLRVQVGGRDLECFAAAAAFTIASGRVGLLVVVDETSHRHLSPAQGYVLQAQAAHCRTLLELADAHRCARDERVADGVASERLRLLESVAVHARDSIVITEAEPLDLPGPRILFCNAAFTRATGYAAEEVLGKTPRILQGPETSAIARAKLREAFASWRPVEVELVNYRKDGTPFWVELSIVPVANEAGWFTHWVSVQREITERKAAEELAMRMRVTQIENEMLATEIQERKRVEAELLYAAFHDSLTRLRNRAFFMERLSGAIERQRANAANSCAVLFLDLDRFKVVNDSLGHSAGDTLLKEIARRLKSCMRPQDTLARIGGDEFAVLIEDAAELEAAAAIAERIIEAMRTPVRLGRQEVFPACSIGIVQSSRYDNPQVLLRDADMAMYEAKRAGYGSYAVFNEVMHADAVAKLELQTDLRLALARGEFEIVYQPIIHLASGQASGFEALLRWRHPVRGLISPAEFIDAIEEIGLIRQIDGWVRVEACRQLKAWQEASGRPDLHMSINASATEFADPNFASDLADLLTRFDLAPSTVQLEITEGIFLDPTAGVIGTVEQLRHLGVRIALDDFGTGYSSLSYINRYPIDTIKIDRSFVIGMIANERTFAVVDLIVSLGRKLDLAIVAEGVETAEQAAALAAIGCGFGQGYHYARPAPAAVAQALLIG
ncbi:putative bifunctional diguanylate cyclase/phosphodiesterase [Sphingomonas radiodurans]|uniref:putative bifunctional diguanylate cyclase/phosphodiesterase n=1 Tax=Sphingomonas radiodurans TaxID=2890321 RepID=UPI001E4652C6|nr:EAL domain-containing protein [Sphingomonas radiodurans]WBH15077.1 EAL domain-containing protein [Sphingomonas radiodurans]